jgi:hypothetical protein
LPRYQREHPEETKSWNVVYDDRGHLIEPHTGRQIGIGTLAVRKYLAASATPPALAAIEPPNLSFQMETIGPRHRYGAILFIEKEGFYPLLQQARIAERYDVAIMSTKGMGSTSGRELIEQFAEEVLIFVLHDFDKEWFFHRRYSEPRHHPVSVHPTAGNHRPRPALGGCKRIQTSE